MNVVLDNIIFSFQKAGGISVVWCEHIKRILTDNRFSVNFIEHEKCENNVFRKLLSITSKINTAHKSIPLRVREYFPEHCSYTEPYIFHSSVYRYDSNNNAINIVTVHDFAYERYVGGLRCLLNGFMKSRAIHKADAIICISQSTKNDLLHYLKGIDERKIHVVYNGVSNDYHVINDSEYSIIIPFDNKKFVLYVGNRRDYKNFSSALYACEHLNIPLVIAGGEKFTKEEMDDLENKIGNDNFYITGKISNKELNELYNRAALLLYPSLYEGFGIPILEAQKAGCPVVCLSLSSIPEVMGESQFCLKDISGESILKATKLLLDNSELREKEILRGFENSSKFSWDKTYSETIKVYEKAFRNKQ